MAGACGPWGSTGSQTPCGRFHLGYLPRTEEIAGHNERMTQCPVTLDTAG